MGRVLVLRRDGRSRRAGTKLWKVERVQWKTDEERWRNDDDGGGGEEMIGVEKPNGMFFQQLAKELG